MISIGDESYLHDCEFTKRWYDSDFISSYGTLLAHESHTSADDGRPVTIQFIPCSYPNEAMNESACCQLSGTIMKVVSVLYDTQHFVLAELDLASKVCKISDGLQFSLRTWKYHVTNLLKRCKLICIDSVSSYDPKTKILSIIGGVFDDECTIEWDDKFIKQVDGYNCGPLACLKLQQIFTSIDAYEGIDPDNYRSWVVSSFRTLVKKYNDKLFVSVPVYKLEGCEDAEQVEHATCDVDCFCGDDKGPVNATIIMKCCKKVTHAECAYRWFDSCRTCHFCRKPVKEFKFQGTLIPFEEKNVIVSHGKDLHFNGEDHYMEKPINAKPSTPTTAASTSTPSISIAAACTHFHSKEAEEKTPLREADRARAEA